MALPIRDFKPTGQWAADADTVIPTTPIAGRAYRKTDLTETDARSGQPYDTIWESARNNQKDYEATGIAGQVSKYGFPVWTPLEDYVVGSIQLGSDEVPYRCIQDHGPGSVGSKDPTTTTGYWVTLAFYLGVLPTPTTAQNFYLRNDGDDANNGLTDTPSGAFRTLMGAYNSITKRQYVNPNAVSLRITTGGEFGNSNGSTVAINPSLLSASSLYIIGNANCPTISVRGDTYKGLVFYGGGTVFLLSDGDRTSPAMAVNFSPNDHHPNPFTALAFEDVSTYIQTNISINLNTPSTRVGTMSYLGFSNCPAAAMGTDEVTGGPVTLSLSGKSLGVAITANDSNLACGANLPGGLGTVFNIGGITGSPAFINIARFSSFRVYTVGPTVFNGSQAGIGRRYQAAVYSGFDTVGSGVNFFPGTLAGSVDANSYCYYR